MMKFTQFAVVDWTDGRGRGYTILALGDDGVVYKSVPKFPGPQHHGWLPLSGTILPGDARVQRTNRDIPKMVHAQPEAPVAVETSSAAEAA
jgi:hypothetical protein